ncbi:MAG: acyl-CoA dehydrogenase family protein, partial [Actinomycetota bacterium]|nr:acyl-CoA dehydrogenase family protein [Actinomycetota bacterium]
ALLGAAGEGWAVASDMLRHQRIARGTGHVGGVAHELFDRLTAPRSEPLTDPVVCDELTRLHMAEVIQSLVALRTRAEMQKGGTPGPMGSLTKLIAAEVEARYSQLVFRVLGADSQAWQARPDPGDLSSDNSSNHGAGGEWTRAAIFALSRSIAGGTSEIQRNSIGERALGLPREPQA